MLVSVKIIAKMNIGELNERRALLLKEKLRDLFPLEIKSNDIINAKIFADSQKGASLLLTSNEATYTLEGNNVVPDYQKLAEVYKIICDTLILDEKLQQVSIIYVDIDNSTTGDGFMQTKNLLTGSKLENLSDFMGVGYRFLINKGSDIWEFKIEPYIRNKNMIFYQGICNYKSEQDINNIGKIVQESLGEFDSRIKDINNI